jgi:hypothetical protein
VSDSVDLICILALLAPFAAGISVQTLMARLIPIVLSVLKNIPTRRITPPEVFLYTSPSQCRFQLRYKKSRAEIGMHGRNKREHLNIIFEIYLHLYWLRLTSFDSVARAKYWHKIVKLSLWTDKIYYDFIQELCRKLFQHRHVVVPTSLYTRDSQKLLKTYK